MKNNLNYYITDYFKIYLPKIRTLSKNTILSYRDTFILLINFLNTKSIDINHVDLNIINFKIIEEFLIYLENEKKNTLRTINQRLASIHSFFKYLQKRELSCFEVCSNILSIPFKKFSKKSIAYFSLKEIEILLNTPNTLTKQGFRDYILLFFLYESACRAQELCDLKLNQLNLMNNNFVILKGKGNKERMVPISDNLSKVFKKYIEIFKINSQDYVFKNRDGKNLTRKGVEYILEKYIKIAKNKFPNLFSYKYSNHSMRHSRAMHLLESGVNLIYIRDILGHSSVITTEEYAKANPKLKEKQILEHANALEIKEKYSCKEKEDLLKFLQEQI